MFKRTVTVGGTCPICGKYASVEMPRRAYQRWIEGEFIQVAWPNSTPEEREIALSNSHGKCFDKMFPEEESDDYDDDYMHD